MLIHHAPGISLQSLTTAEHLAPPFTSLVYADADYIIRLSRSGSPFPFLLEFATQPAPVTYLDVFALRLGMKESLTANTPSRHPLIYGCPRAIRDVILTLPEEEIEAIFGREDCPHQDCQYWMWHPGWESSQHIACLLARLRLFDIEQGQGLTLEEIGKLLNCGKERSRQIIVQIQQKIQTQLSRPPETLRGTPQRIRWPEAHRVWQVIQALSYQIAAASGHSMPVSGGDWL
jgi:hypothetical protein